MPLGGDARDFGRLQVGWKELSKPELYGRPAQRGLAAHGARPVRCGRTPYYLLTALNLTQHSHRSARVCQASPSLNSLRRLRLFFFLNNFTVLQDWHSQGYRPRSGKIVFCRKPTRGTRRRACPHCLQNILKYLAVTSAKPADASHFLRSTCDRFAQIHFVSAIRIWQY